MPSIVRSDAVENCLRRLLAKDGFKLTAPRRNGETGVDIVATKRTKRFHIEAIGFKSQGPARSRDFYEALFRAISRVKDGATQCVIALPSRAAHGLPQRASHYGIAWQRIGQAFPELQIWLVDTDNPTYTKTTWNEWPDGKG